VTPDEADPALDFRAAVALLDAGANRDAAAAFARFVANHPHDERAEDAAYLRVLALQRCGAAADGEMRRAAREYLRLYPAGFRRGEVEKL
jgi:TolA-binding protein